MIKRVIGIYFSPVGGTAKMTNSLASGIASNLNEACPFEVSYESCNLLTLKDETLKLDNETIAVIGMPVYIGKVPLPALEKLRRIEPNGAISVAAVSYGGRSFGDALYELQHEAEEIGFNIIGAGAFSIKYGKLKDKQFKNDTDSSSRASHPDSDSHVDSSSLGNSTSHVDNTSPGNSASHVDNTSLGKFINAASSKIKRLSGCEVDGMKIKPAPLEVAGKLPVHGISKLSPKAAALAQELLEKLNITRKDSEWFL